LNRWCDKLHETNRRQRQPPCSQREAQEGQCGYRACRLTGFSRSAAWRPLHDMLVIEGQVANHKRTYLIYCEEGLQVRTKKRKKLVRPRVPMLLHYRCKKSDNREKNVTRIQPIRVGCRK